MQPAPEPSPGKFEILREQPGGFARCGRLHTAHGFVHTPVFMPVGTQGSVKGVWPEQLDAAGAEVLLANTYHLALRPGAERVEKLGGLHAFMGWPRALLTDSGGFQVFSLARLREIREEGIAFRSHLDGSSLFLSPEKSVEIQNRLGADIIMAFDECPALPCEEGPLSESVRRTARWLLRSKAAHRREDQLLFGIVQGGTHEGLRRESLERTLEADLPGLAIGGLAVGESREQRLAVLAFLAALLPRERPHYLMGVGTPLDLVESVALGIDMFDCVMPTRVGRHGVAFTSSGRLRLRNQAFESDGAPLDSACGGPCCSRFSRGYLRHLLMAGEPLGAMALSLHNIYYYTSLMARIRAAIRAATFPQLLGEVREIYQRKDPESDGE